MEIPLDVFYTYIVPKLNVNSKINILLIDKELYQMHTQTQIKDIFSSLVTIKIPKNNIIDDHTRLYMQITQIKDNFIKVADPDNIYGYHHNQWHNKTSDIKGNIYYYPQFKVSISIEKNKNGFISYIRKYIICDIETMIKLIYKCS